MHPFITYETLRVEHQDRMRPAAADRRTVLWRPRHRRPRT